MSEELGLYQLKEELKKRGIKFHHSAGINKLSELWSVHADDPLVEKNEEEEEETPPCPPKAKEPKGEYEALRNVKHNGTYYKAGERYDIMEKEAKQLLKLGYIK
jgi:hypothetical protein